MGVDNLLVQLGTSKNELSEAILDPFSYHEIWSRARASVGGHDYNDLQLLHDTACFIHDNEGRIPVKGLDELRDYFQDPEDYTTYCLIPALRDLGLVEQVQNDIVALTPRAHALKRDPRLLGYLIDGD